MYLLALSSEKTWKQWHSNNNKPPSSTVKGPCDYTGPTQVPRYLAPKSWLFNTIFHWKKKGFFGEIVDFRPGAGKVQDVPRISPAQKQGSSWRMVETRQKDTKGSSHWSNTR